MTAFRREKRFARFLRVSALAAAAAILAATYLLFDAFPSREWRGKTVSIPKGSSLDNISAILSGERTIPHPAAFRGVARLTRTERMLQYGEYTFPTPPSAYAVWKKLVTGDVVKYPVVVRPGTNLFEVAALLGAYSLAEPAEFLEEATSRSRMAKMGIEAESAEGYIVPDTYNLVKTMGAARILEVMVRPFRERFTPEMEQKAAMAGLSVHQVMTIASIIEKETGVPEEKPLVSAVIRNRMKLGMPLQMDPTVIYGARRFDGTVTRKDLQLAGPYNTYLNLGLPPGPIANPAPSSIAAALQPAKSDYLYFVSNNDGTHTFSKTLAGHALAVENLRRLQKEAAGKKALPEDLPPAPAATTLPLPPSGPS
jgi:UPF0755 protein